MANPSYCLTLLEHPMAQVTEQDLKFELDDLRERCPKLKDDELFVAWFMKCFITDTEREAVESLVGGSNDKSLDALHVDHPARKVYLVQGKLRERLDGGNEKRTDVLAFTDLAATFSEADAMAALKKGMAPAAAEKMDEARKALERSGYRLHLYYVTTGKVSPALREEAKKAVRRLGDGAAFEAFDGQTVMRLLSDYLDGVAPPVPELEFELENGATVNHTSMLQRFDREVGIESWVVPVAVSQVADLYESAGIRLFARNVRGYLGDTKINHNLRHTLEHEPEFFWYYNNGITIVCDAAEKRSRSGKDFLRLVNPQIINGQQTTRTLHEYARTGVRAAVMVRVISVPRGTAEESQRFEQLISKIVAATNWQNEIKASDLMSNDRRQIDLERNLRKLDYQYLRKRQSKGEAKRQTGGIHRFQITKEELAQVSAACELDPMVLRLGKENLFGENYYNEVFPCSDAEHYLLRYWLGRQIARVTQGIPERSYMKWLAVHFIWRRLNGTLGRRARRQVFRSISERGGFEHLSKAIDTVFKVIAAYHRDNSGTGETRLDVSSFFRLKGHHRKFEKYWESCELGHIDAFNRTWARFVKEIDVAEEA